MTFYRLYRMYRGWGYGRRNALRSAIAATRRMR
jgi:hypothetical protein